MNDLGFRSRRGYNGEQVIWTFKRYDGGDQRDPTGDVVGESCPGNTEGLRVRRSSLPSRDRGGDGLLGESGPSDTCRAGDFTTRGVDGPRPRGTHLFL